MKQENKAFAVANYILDVFEQKNILNPTNNQMQLIIYIAYGIHLCLYGKKLFDEPMQAWEMGVVTPCVFNEFKSIKNKPIEKYSRAVILDTKIDNDLNFITPALQDDNCIRSVLIACLTFRNKRAFTFLKKLKKENSAWQKAYNLNKGTMLNDRDIAIEFEQYMDVLARMILD